MSSSNPGEQKRLRTYKCLSLWVTALVAVLLGVLWTLGIDGWSAEEENSSTAPGNSRLIRGDGPEQVIIENLGGDARREVLAEQPSKDRAEGREVVTGIVIDHSGVGVPNARVSALLSVAPGVAAFARDLVAKETVLGSTQSDEDGGFELVVLAARSLVLQAESEGFVPGRIQPVHAGNDHVIILHRGAVIRGLVIMEDTGEPVEGATVRCWRASSKKEVFKTSTDGAGRFAGGPVAPGHVRVEVLTDRGAARWTDLLIRVGDLPPEVTIRVERGRSLQGRVTDARTGVPLTGVEVSDSWTFKRTTLTNEQGFYRFTGHGFRSGDKLHVRARGYGRLEERIVPERGDEDVVVDFALRKSRLARGRILTGDGQPLSRANVVALVYGSGMDRVAGQTDTSGSFVLEGLRPDCRHTLLIFTDAQDSWAIEFPPNEGEMLNIELGTVVVGATVPIRGTALTEGGDAALGLRVVLNGSGTERWQLWGTRPPRNWMRDLVVARRETRPTSAGAFLFPGAPAGNYTVELQDDAGRVLDAEAVKVVAGQRVDEVHLRCSASGSLSGAVVDERGEGVGGVRVVARGGRAGAPSEFAQITTGGEGRFAFLGLDEGAFDVVAYPWDRRSMGGATQYATTALDGVRPSDSPVLLKLRMAEWISGTVDGPAVDQKAGVVFVCARDGSGLEVASQRVSVPGDFALRVPAEEALTIEVWPDYRFTASGEKSGMLVASGSYRQLARVEAVEPGSSDLEILWDL